MSIKTNKEKLAKKMQEPVFDGVQCGTVKCPYFDYFRDQECVLFDEDVLFDDENQVFLRCMRCTEIFEETQHVLSHLQHHKHNEEIRNEN